MRYLVVPLDHRHAADTLAMLSSSGDTALRQLAQGLAINDPVPAEFSHPLISQDLDAYRATVALNSMGLSSINANAPQASEGAAPGITAHNSTSPAPSGVLDTPSDIITLTDDERRVLIALRSGKMGVHIMPSIYVRGQHATIDGQVKPFTFADLYMQQPFPDSVDATAEATIPPNVYAHAGNFFDMCTRLGQGEEFYLKWRRRMSEFPTWPINIKLTRNVGGHPSGSIHEVITVVPHGGHSDSAQQYVLRDGTHILSDYAVMAKSSDVFTEAQRAADELEGDARVDDLRKQPGYADYVMRRMTGD